MASKSNKLVRPCKGTMAFRHDLGFDININQAAKLLIAEGYECKAMVQGLAILFKDDHELSLYSFGKILMKDVGEEQANSIAERVIPIVRQAKA